MQIKDYLTKLISYKTFEGNPNKATEIAKLYEMVLKSIPSNYEYKFIETNGVKNLIIANKIKKKHKLVLSAHVDVVPGPEKLFHADIKKNKLIGRGASDMKFAVAVYIKLLNNLANKHDVAVWLTADEELGGNDGTRHLVEDLGYRCSICFMPDGSNHYSLITKSKGVAHYKISAQGKSTHGATPWLGENSVDNLIKAYEQIKQFKIFTKRDRNHWHNTYNLGRISGGEATNSVPSFSEMFVDFRFIDMASFHKLQKSLKSLGKQKNITVELLGYGHPFDLDEKDKNYKLFEKVVKQNKIPLVKHVDYGTSDARFLAEKGINTIIYKPECDGDHEDYEWVDLDSLDKYYSTLLDFARNF